MKRLLRYGRKGHRTAMCFRASEETVVREGLAYSPAQMARLADRGIPVNGLATAKMFYDGDDTTSFHIGSERERFVDVADLWEQHMTLRDKAREAARVKRLSSKKPK